MIKCQNLASTNHPPPLPPMLLLPQSPLQPPTSSINYYNFPRHDCIYFSTFISVSCCHRPLPLIIIRLLPTSSMTAASAKFPFPLLLLLKEWMKYYRFFNFMYTHTPHTFIAAISVHVRISIRNEWVSQVKERSYRTIFIFQLESWSKAHRFRLLLRLCLSIYSFWHRQQWQQIRLIPGRWTLSFFHLLFGVVVVTCYGFVVDNHLLFAVSLSSITACYGAVVVDDTENEGEWRQRCWKRRRLTKPTP